MQLILVEDDVTIARELTLRWQARRWLVRVCETLTMASKALDDAGADLIVLDLQLPDGDGLAWLERMRQLDRRTPVLILTARDQVTDRIAGLRKGADDYLVKPFAPDELDARLEALQRRTGTNKSTGQSVQWGNLVWLPNEGCAIVDGKSLELSPREFEVLGLLVRYAPRLVSKRVLIDAVAASNLDVGDSAVEVYISRLRRKLADSDVGIQTVRGFGYRLCGIDAANKQTEKAS